MGASLGDCGSMSAESVVTGVLVCCPCVAARILLIEDEAGIADGVMYALQTEGFEPLWCATGGEGLQALRKGAIDLVILDVNLPDIGGFDLCRGIRASSRVPVIFLTARAEEVDRIVGLEIGGDDYVVKPFSPRELTARVKAVLRRIFSTTEGDGGIHVGPFRMEPTSSTILLDGSPLPLSQYEFGILKVLLGRPGHVFTRRRLLERVWDDADAQLERTVDAHVKTLRSKLRDARSDLDPIRTHRGLGYSLRTEP